MILQIVWIIEASEMTGIYEERVKHLPTIVPKDNAMYLSLQIISFYSFLQIFCFK